MTDETSTQNPLSAAMAGAAAPRRKAALGRGLQALLGETRREEPVTAGGNANGMVSVESGLASLLVSSIEPDPDQPRRQFDEAALDELAASIAARGVLQPVIVVPLGEGHYRLVAGERRWRAAQRAKVHEIPALVRKLTQREVMAIALIENLQREDLNPIEEARAYQRLAESESMTQAEIAKMVDKSRSHVANIQRLLALPDPVTQMVEAGELSMGHARALIGVEDAEALARQAVAKGSSVREVEQMVRRQSGREAPTQRRARNEFKSAESADIQAMQAHLEEFLGLSVKITVDADPRSGAVTIRYRTLDQLDLICQRLTGEGI
ncbi:ParB family chromosome partitioning protein [Novosphingobium sp. SG751A]|uniref:ParB/RepB/Spo0J family partition protein n=1 Tax=Novosphingobium sp. SG751A TaxID=2587000 RepID=UPI0015523A79|nr:ParB family chromosome partitioning protein [Novosphingobium sp. SG751A]